MTVYVRSWAAIEDQFLCHALGHALAGNSWGLWRAAGTGGRNPGDRLARHPVSQRHPGVGDGPDARLYRKSAGTAATLCFMGHVLAQNRNGLIVDA